MNFCFLMSYDLFSIFRFSSMCFNYYWDNNTIPKCSNNKTIIRKMVTNHSKDIKEYFEKSVEILYMYIENHQSIGGLPDISDISRRLDDLDGSIERMVLGLPIIYEIIHKSLINCNGT
ncbi:hypothetical protein THOM_2038 [Trachipleistophora hominis]|uniref:Uncharacterized protein n=1 Tax=Trachipleistophora hominis TaxID=72359 RepID=L7JVB7_TRAHO|nr:hypothetical protein THOM_2038 [Trachipleistophora hominis]